MKNTPEKLGLITCKCSAIAVGKFNLFQGIEGGSSDDGLLFEGIDDWGVTYTLKH